MKDQAQEHSEDEKPFDQLTLEEMEAKIESDANSKEEQAKEKSEDKPEQESAEEEPAKDKSEAEEAEDKTESEKKDNQDSESEKIRKQYKELQSEFTKRSQELAKLRKELEAKTSGKEETKDSEESDEELEQLKAKYPDAAKLFEKIADRKLKTVVGEKVKPIHDQVVLRSQEENIAKFNSAIDAFKSSDLAELEAEVLAVYNEDPEKWASEIQKSSKAFESLKNEAILRNIDKVAEIKSRKKASSVENKTREVGKAFVGGKSKTSRSAGVPSLDEFKKLSLEEMEALLPKATD